jgi:hypothetical protein
MPDHETTIAPHQNGSVFSYRSARSGAITAAISAAVVIESAAVHFAVAVRHPWIAWALTLTSVAALVWLAGDYQGLGTGLVRLHGDRLRLTIGRRYDVAIPLSEVARVIKPTFRDLPTPGTTQGRDYVNLTKPAAANVLIGLAHPLRVRLPGGLHRDVTRLGLKLDDPDAFMRAVEAQRSGPPARSA